MNRDSNAKSVHENRLAYPSNEREAIYRVIRERRDVRHFKSGPAIPADTLDRLFNAAHQAPNVGLMQPGRWIQIRTPETRERIAALVDQEQQRSAQRIAQIESDERAQAFLSLKVHGIDHCAELFVVCLRDRRENEIFGRRTLPSMDLASVACSIQNFWLAARAEGLGVGWVSMFDPRELASLLSIPDDAAPVAILCLGHAEAFDVRPRLEIDNWRQGRPLESMLMQDQWEDR